MILPVLALVPILLLSQDSSTDLPTTAPAVSAGVQLKAASEVAPTPNLVQPTNSAVNRTAGLEHCAAFRKSAREAWRATHNGAAPFEAGFSIDKEGRPGRIQLSLFATTNSKIHLRIISTPTALGTLHVHTKYGEPTPSPDDINSAKALHKMVYVESRLGLYRIDADGNVRHIIDDQDWFNKE